MKVEAHIRQESCKVSKPYCAKRPAIHRKAIHKARHNSSFILSEGKDESCLLKLSAMLLNSCMCTFRGTCSARCLSRWLDNGGHSHVIEGEDDHVIAQPGTHVRVVWQDFAGTKHCPMAHADSACGLHKAKIQLHLTSCTVATAFPALHCICIAVSCEPCRSLLPMSYKFVCLQSCQNLALF